MVIVHRTRNRQSFKLAVDRTILQLIDQLSSTVLQYRMAFLNSPILKSRRLGALSPETERKFLLARERPHKPDLSDFKKLHQSIAKTQKSFALLDMNANVNALKRINEETKKHTEKLDNLKEGFNKVHVNEKTGFEYDERVVNDVRERIICSMIDPQGGMSTSSVSVSRRSSEGMSRCSDLDLSISSATLLPDLTEGSPTLKPQSFQDTEDLFDTDTESILSDFEMEIINVSRLSNNLPDNSFPRKDEVEFDHVDTEKPASHVSQKSIILSPSGMYCIDNEEEEYAIVSEVRVSPNYPFHDHASDPQWEMSSSSDLDDNISEFELSPVTKESPDSSEGLKLSVGLDSRKPRCATCASWDACTWICSQKDQVDEVKEDLNMVIEEDENKTVQIAVFRSPVLARKASVIERDEECIDVNLVPSATCEVNFKDSGSYSAFQTGVTKLEDSESDVSEVEAGERPSFDQSIRPVDSECDKETGALQIFLENFHKHDDMDSISVSESLETKSLESCDFLRQELTMNGQETTVKSQTKAPPNSRRQSSNARKLKNEKAENFATQSCSVLHSASADFAKFGLNRSESSANLRSARSSSTTSFYKRSCIPTPNYNLTKTLFPNKEEKLDLDTRLKLRDKDLIEVEPLLRWKKKPIFAMTTTGHKAWYERAQDMIERRRREIVNMNVLEEDIENQDLDIIVSS